MSNPNFVLLYVDSPKASATFYAGLLDRQPVETSPTFAMFALDSGLMLGLWSRHTAEPTPIAGGGGGAELAFQVDDAAAVDASYHVWSGKDLRVLQRPVDLNFGRTFVVLDPDGHRLRVFAPAR
jgi:predicted enzyme related to lactoylglutathione lyase